jgi:hypothetical protein
MSYNINQFNELRQAILDKIEDDETSIQEAHFEQPENFGGSPAAVVGVSPNEALYNSNHTDRMTFAFTIMIYIPMKEDNIHEVEEAMGQAYWEVLHMFNKRNVFDGVVTGLDTVHTEPLPSVWSYEERGEGVFRVAEINLRVVAYMSNR